MLYRFRSIPASSTLSSSIRHFLTSLIPGEPWWRPLESCVRRGWLAVFDGDYPTTTVALGENDPLQVCVDAMVANSLTNRWLVRGLAALVRNAGFQTKHVQSHGFVDTSGGDYMLSIIDRGAEILAASGASSEDTAKALKAEARRRATAGTFFGHVAYASLTARKP